MDLTTTHIAGVFETRSILENPSYSVTSKEFVSEFWGMSAESTSGEKVSLDKAWQVAAFWQLLKMIAEDCASLDPEVIKRVGEKKQPDRDDPASFIIRKEFNSEMSAYEGRVAMHARALLGNGTAFIERDSRGNPIAVYPIDCKIELVDGALVYTTFDSKSGEEYEIPARDILHYKGFSLDGYVGMDVLRAAKEVLGQYLSAQKYTGRFFKNGAQAGGVYTLPPGTKPEAANRLEKGITEKYSNPERWFQSIFLRDGVQWQGTSFDPQKAQLIDQKVSFAIDLCRYFRVNPAMIGVPGYSSYNSLYEAKEQYLDQCLAPRLRAEKVAIERRLLNEKDYRSEKKFIEHNTRALLRMKPTERAQVYASAINAAWMSPDEVRAAENMPPRPDGKGGEYAALPMANNSGGANKTPANPNDPAEPGKETEAFQGKQSKAARAELILGMLAHAKSKIAKPNAYKELIRGGMISHRNSAEKAGFSGDFMALFDDLSTVSESISVEEATERLETIAAKWKENIL